MTTHAAITSIVQRLAAVPVGADVSLVIRHAEGEDIPAGTFGHDVSLTGDGVAASERLGAALSERGAISVVSSPVPRCVQTAEAILRGAGSSTTATTDRRLGDPGPFVVEPNVSGPLFLELPISEIARRQLQDADPQPGMRPTAEGVEILLNLTTGNLGEGGRLDIFVTHDVILGGPGCQYHRAASEKGWMARLPGRAIPMAFQDQAPCFLERIPSDISVSTRRLGR